MAQQEFETVALALAREVTDCLSPRFSIAESAGIDHVGADLHQNFPISQKASSRLRADFPVPPYFQDRDRERAKIRTFLQHPFLRLLRVVGPSGTEDSVGLSCPE